METTFFQFIQKGSNALLLALAVTSGTMLLWPLLRRSGGSWISAARATQLVNREDGLLLDVREAGDYQAGHIFGAKNLPLSRLDAGTLPGDLAKRKAQPLIVYCERGERSGKAAAGLRKLGFERVTSLTGGLGAWRQAGLPVSK